MVIKLKRVVNYETEKLNVKREFKEFNLNWDETIRDETRRDEIKL